VEIRFSLAAVSIHDSVLRMGYTSSNTYFYFICLPKVTYNVTRKLVCSSCKSFWNSPIYFTVIDIVNKEMYIDILRRLRNWSEGNSQKMGNQHLVPTSRQCSSTLTGFGHGFLSKKQCDNNVTSPMLY
jgi:hypothetical protein